MRRTTVILGTLVSLTVVLTGCDSGVQKLDGQATPAGDARPTASSTTASQPSAPSSSSPLSSSPKPPKASRSSALESRPLTVIGPRTLGALRLGMTVQQAQVTGMIENYKPHKGHLDAACGTSHLKAAETNESSVFHSDKRGVIFIPAYGRIATPEGIRIGSTLAQVQAAYRDFKANEIEETLKTGNGRAWAGRSDPATGVHYRFKFRDKKVVEVGIQADRQECYEDF